MAQLSPSLLSLFREVDWLLPEYRTRLKMIRQYNRILSMDDQHKTKKVYKWDRSLNTGNMVSSWTNEIRDIFYGCGLNAFFDNDTEFPLRATISTIKDKLG